MKKYLILLTVAGTVVMSGCGFFDSFTKFRMNYSEEFTIPHGVPPNIPYDIPTPYFPTNSQQYFDQNGTNPDLVEGVKLERFFAIIQNPPNTDFSFLQSIEVYLRAPGLNDVRIASQTDIPLNADTLFLTPDKVELVDYLKQDSIGLRVKVLTDENLQEDLNTKVTGTFLVDAKILGI